jgi:hypothetical protein
LCDLSHETAIQEVEGLEEKRGEEDVESDEEGAVGCI